MVSNEKIAHDLTIIYLSNRYGVTVTGNFSMSDGTGSGDVSTKHLPSTDEQNYRRVGTGERGLFGLEKKVWIEDGFEVDDIFIEMLKEYRSAYKNFLNLLEND